MSYEETRLQESAGGKGIVDFCDFDRVQRRFVVRLRLGRVSEFLASGCHTVFRACMRAGETRARTHTHTHARTHARTNIHNANTRT
jgi:hypothetical protein